ncbi:ATP-binding protein [Thermodesulfatator indicus]
MFGKKIENNLIYQIYKIGKIAEKAKKNEEKIQEILSLIEKIFDTKKIFLIFIEEKNKVITNFEGLNNKRLLDKVKGEWLEKLEREKAINIIGELITSDKSKGLIALIPITRQKNLTGLILLENEARQSKLTQEELIFLFSIAHIIGNIINLEKTKEETIKECQKTSQALIHNIKNTLQNISFSAEKGLIHRKDKDKYLKDIIKTSQEGEKTTKDFLEIHFKRSFASKIKVDINELIKKQVHRIKQENLTIKLNLEENLPKITGKEHIIEQILEHIITNAYQAIKGKGTIKIESKREGEYIKVKIVDSGPGIPENIKEKIFKLNFTTQKAGTGLGLTFSKESIEEMGGKIFLDNKEKETTFVLLFPLKTIKLNKFRLITILVVEDEEIIRNILTEFLREKGFKVFQAADFEEAINIIETSSNIDFLITDMHIPGGKGTKIARVAKDKFPSLNIIFITGSIADLIDTKDGIVIQKPFEMENLLEVIMNTLENHPNEPQP